MMTHIAWYNLKRVSLKGTFQGWLCSWVRRHFEFIFYTITVSLGTTTFNSIALCRMTCSTMIISRKILWQASLCWESYGWMSFCVEIDKKLSKFHSGNGSVHPHTDPLLSLFSQHNGLLLGQPRQVRRQVHVRHRQQRFLGQERLRMFGRQVVNHYKTLLFFHTSE